MRVPAAWKRVRFQTSPSVLAAASRTVGSVTTSLAPQWTLLASTAYTFPNDAALALILSYTSEGNPETNGNTLSATRRTPLLGAAGLYPLTDAWRLQGGLYLTPPVSQLGRNTPAILEMVLSVIRSWS